jgi:two-component system, NtrC family, sensor kinase
VFDIATAESDGGGVVGESVNVRAFEGAIVNTRVGRSGYAYAVAPGERPIAYPINWLKRPGFGEVPPERISIPQVEAAFRATSDVGSTTGRYFRFPQQKVLSAWATVDPVGWKVFVEQPESEAFASLRGKVWRTALLLLVFLAGALAASFLLARRLVRPIRRMRLAAARIRAGAYDERIELAPRRAMTFRRPPPVSLWKEPDRRVDAAQSVVAQQHLAERVRQDDLGALAEDLNRMAASLQESHTQLEQKVEERTRELQATLEELAEKSRELEVASEHKSEFLANMSHELRTPLNAILGFSEVLREQLVEAGQIGLEVAPFSLPEALERGIVMVRERAATNGIGLELTLDPDVNVVEGDQRRIRQVVFNLLSNAVKFTPEGGRVDVATQRVDGDVRVAVRDTGPGIAADEQELIFEAFHQARTGDGDRPEGTGLGLALSKRLIELHGGRIWVESQPGEGGTFVFTLPVGSS